MLPNVLSIAGVDPSGGAGTHADLKTFAALGGYGMAVVTALTAQNTRGVQGMQAVPPEFVTAQLDSLFADVRVDAVKIGVLADAGVVRAVAAALDRYQPPYVVLDPVMVAKSGDRLLPPDAVSALRDELLPRVDVVTPNLPEAADLLGEPEVKERSGMAAQAARLHDLGARGVLLKGGHLAGERSVDLLLVDGIESVLDAPRIATRNTHGTGCTLSSALAVLRPQRAGWRVAAREAKDYLTGALRAADRLEVGHGHGPVHHFWKHW